VRASDPRNRADGLKIGRIPLTCHAALTIAEAFLLRADEVIE
jgi:hypothetical protein